ncbi:hypothetical protein, partial [Rhodoferax sp.]|uniref:hypothetical protein n=1 Tax=Rhodoferax sp. TaxID=50421 RepID=UPI002719AC5D
EIASKCNIKPTLVNALADMLRKMVVICHTTDESIRVRDDSYQNRSGFPLPDVRTFIAAGVQGAAMAPVVFIESTTSV